MTEQILEISERGQITIPKKIRNIFPGQFVTIKIEGKNIVLSPLETVNQFLDDLDEAHQDWKKNGGISLSELEEKYQQ